MEHAIRKHCKIHFNEDPALYTKLSDRLEAVIRRHKDDWDRLVTDLEALRNEIKQGRPKDDGGVSRQESPFFDRVCQIAYGELDAESPLRNEIKKFIKNVVDELQQTIGIVNFWSNSFGNHATEGTAGGLNTI